MAVGVAQFPRQARLNSRELNTVIGLGGPCSEGHQLDALTLHGDNVARGDVYGVLM
jgi:hypothetical protein